MIDLTKEERASAGKRRRAAHYNKGFSDGYIKGKSEASHDAPALPFAAHALELDGVDSALAYGKGIWRTCSGCHEANEGYPTGPYSDTLKCHLGGGCFECGGLGAVWDTTDYEEMGNFIALSATKQDIERKPEFTISFTGMDGCATVLSHWPEGYALQRHGEIVWRENIALPETLDQRMKSAGMYTIEEMMGVTPLTKWKSNPAINTVEHFSGWLDQKTAEYLRMKAGYDLGDKSEDDELYEWVLAHAGVFSSIRDQFRVISAQEQDKAIPDGWRLVPKEPTRGMVEAADDERPLPESFLIDAYRAMVAAAPAAKQEG